MFFFCAVYSVEMNLTFLALKLSLVWFLFVCFSSRILSFSQCDFLYTYGVFLFLFYFIFYILLLNA